MRLNRYSFNFIPASQDSDKRGGRINTIMQTPLRNGFCFIVNCQFYITSVIAVVFFVCHPMTIFRAVISIIILPVYAKAIRCFAHVGVKMFKFMPSRTNGDTSPAIVFIFFPLVVKASFFNALPNIICAGAGHSMSNFYGPTMASAGDCYAFA